MSKEQMHIALAGQQNAGKSTIFNMLTGARQHVANYPGVTVDKKTGYYNDNEGEVEIVDLPGTYNLTSFSLEERVARDYLLNKQPEVVVNVADASKLKRSLYLLFQVMDMDFPTVMALNMMDVAKSHGLEIDVQKLSNKLKIPVIATVGSKEIGKSELQQEIRNASTSQKDNEPLRVDYGDITPTIETLEEVLAKYKQALDGLPIRWLAVKLLERDSEAKRLLSERLPQESEQLLQQAEDLSEKFEANFSIATGDHIMVSRDRLASKITEECVIETKKGQFTFTQVVDKFLLNRALAPIFLLLTIWVIYQLSIVKGYELTHYTWPILAGFRNLVADILPAAGFLHDPYVRSIGLWMVDSANTLLNYIPVFLILFSLIAILEDSGYMARMAFILDKIFHRFGLHGASTLPMILGGIFAGGCAVPGVMTTKAIPDERARFATILTVPFMNCLAKVPLYTLLINIFFVAHQAWAMVFVSTITVIFALLIAKLLSVTVLKTLPTSPFVMELPNYHLPTFRGVVTRAVERTWIYIKKVGTIVVAVAVVVFSLLQFPGLDDERTAFYEAQGEKALAVYHKKISSNPYESMATGSQLVPLINYYSSYKAAKLNARGKSASLAVNDKFKQRNADLFIFVKPGKDKDAKKVNRAIRKLTSKRKSLRRQMKEERIVSSILGRIGKSLEPVTQYAGFDWKVNVALLASFAARESSVATLGVLFQQSDDENLSLEERMSKSDADGGKTALNALALMLFFALYPPCLATAVMVKIQTNSYGWMLFSIIGSTAIGLAVASATFTIGNALGMSGIQMMATFYAMALAILVMVGYYKPRQVPSMEPSYN